MPLYYQVPFGSAGDRDTVPVDVQVDGSVSYTEGYGADYSLPRATNPSALTIERTKYNEIIYDITSNIQQYQQHGVPEFITTSDNGGTAYPYAKGALVRYNNGTTTENYISKSNSNTALPTNTTYWTQVSGNTAYLNATQTFTGTCTFSNTIVGNISGNSGTVTTISGLLAAGSNITLTGVGTSASPYTINSNGGVAISGTPTSGQFAIWTDSITIEGADASTARTDLGLGTSATKDFINDDTMATATSTNVPSALSVKNYVDSKVQSLVVSLDLSAGTLSSSTTASAWTKITTAVVGVNGITGASVSSGVISLPAGTYVIESFTSLAVNGGVTYAGATRVINTTDASTLAVGNTVSATSQNSGVSCSSCVFTITGTKNIELQYYVSNVGMVLGNSSSGTLNTGEVNRVAQMIIKKIN